MLEALNLITMRVNKINKFLQEEGDLTSSQGVHALAICFELLALINEPREISVNEDEVERVAKAIWRKSSFFVTGEWPHTLGHGVVDHFTEQAKAAIAAMATKRELVNKAVLKETMMQHWLMSVECNHEKKTDRAQCSCSRWRGEEMLSVGKAVENYFEHFWESYSNSIEVGESNGK